MKPWRWHQDMQHGDGWFRFSGGFSRAGTGGTVVYTKHGQFVPIIGWSVWAFGRGCNLHIHLPGLRLALWRSEDDDGEHSREFSIRVPARWWERYAKWETDRWWRKATAAPQEQR